MCSEQHDIQFSIRYYNVWRIGWLKLFHRLKYPSDLFVAGHGRCGVAVIRVSGPETKTVLTQMAATASPQQTLDVKPRYATLRKIRHPRTRQLIDEGLVLWFPAPHSFTGEDCCEFHVHGGLAVVSAMNEAINSVHGVRPSLPGEFTKRAFWAGKLDLSQVEGLADLIHAETEVQRKQVSGTVLHGCRSARC